jgi:thioredoxin-like negative regulator of GroEL
MDNYELKYLKYKAKYVSLKNNKSRHSRHSMTGGGNKKQVMLFKADWCGHCTKFKSTWDAISNQYNNKYDFITYDVDKQRKVFEEYKVDSFPTLILKNNNEIINYNGDRSVDDLKQFLDSNYN